MRSCLLATRTLVLATLAALTGAAGAAAQDFDMCGVIVPGVECDRLFQDPSGQVWLPEDFGGFQVGDVVRVVGTTDPTCASFCFAPCVLDNTIGPCADPTTPYCHCASGPCFNADPSAGCANSTGAGGLLHGSGSTSVSSDDLVLTTEHLPPNQSGIYYMGPVAIEVPFGDGLRCVSPGSAGIFRFPVQNAGPSGVIERASIVGFTHANFPPAGQIQPGDTWNFQCWYRDPAGPCGSTFNLSNGAAATFGP